MRYLWHRNNGSIARNLNPVITYKDHLTKENTRIKQVLKDNGYQESITNKIFKKITSNHTTCFSHNNKRKSQISKRKISK